MKQRTLLCEVGEDIEDSIRGTSVILHVLGVMLNYKHSMLVFYIPEPRQWMERGQERERNRKGKGTGRGSGQEWKGLTHDSTTILPACIIPHCLLHLLSQVYPRLLRLCQIGAESLSRLGNRNAPKVLLLLIRP